MGKGALKVLKMFLVYIFYRVFQRKNPVIEIVKMAGQKGTLIFRITLPTVFKIGSCSSAD